MQPIIIRLIALFICVCSCCLCYAQFNDTTNHHFRFATNGSLNKTNDAKAYLPNNNVGFNYNRHKSTLNTYANWIYGQQNKTLTNNDFIATADFDLHNIPHKIYTWGLLSYETSYSLKTRYRFQPGAGIGYVFLDSANAKLTVSDGILYEVTELTDATFGKENYQTFRNSLRVKYHFLIGKLIIVDGSNFWQPSLSSAKDYIFKLNNTVAFKLNQWLSLNATSSYNKTSRTGSENLLLTFGIMLDKYF